MNEKEFNLALRALDSLLFEDRKLNAAKELVKSNTFTSNQVKKILEGFQFESSKIEFMKFVLPKISDKENINTNNDIFKLNSSKQTLDEFLRTNLGWYN